MTHYTISYEGITDPEVKAAKALVDTQQYLGKEKTAQLLRALSQMPDTQMKNALIQLELFVGIAGYPAHVLWETSRKG